jgi:MHS family proline/betaine transporter-like MFS transporter
MSAETYEGVTSTPLQSGTLLSRVKAVAGAGIGNVLEWYDFTVYAYLAGILGTKFFVAGDENTALLATFAVFRGRLRRAAARWIADRPVR